MSSEQPEASRGGGVALRASTGEALPSGYSENVVKIRDVLHGQSLPTAERHFDGEVTDRSGNQDDNDAAEAGENGITGQDHDRPTADRWGQFSPPDLTTFHAPTTGQSEISDSSASSVSCVSAPSPASTR